MVSDTGGEFYINETRCILKKKRIKLTLTMPNTPEQNGCSERERKRECVIDSFHLKNTSRRFIIKFSAIITTK